MPERRSSLNLPATPQHPKEAGRGADDISICPAR
eukprot:CAMPEP_0174715086 /NCGR_PEP_ID=MMETSP1094-20130205/20198_1 /TAXON_ID=156173 /ORGANISM="Chrysochromulina brevifilum, Strain UTEX LB 985" /LENGTH=33 /DNA_ID= /DNA_START= /DNA_END= /DNA_ORIENTATION=